MRMLDPGVVRERWLSRALCRRYAAVVFSTIDEPPLKGGVSQSRTICWALGCLVKGEREILGAWQLDGMAAMPAVVFADLGIRGVEFLRCGLGDLGGLETEFHGAFRAGAIYPSPEQVIASTLREVRPVHRPAMLQLLRARIDDQIGRPVVDAAAGISSEVLGQQYPAILLRWGEAVAGFQPLQALPEPYCRLAFSLDGVAIRMQERLTRAIKRHDPFVDSADAFEYVVEWLLRADQRQMRQAEAEHLTRGAFGSQTGRFVPVLGAAVGTPTLA